MDFQYYWDHGTLPSSDRGWGSIIIERVTRMASPAGIQKLMEHVKRGNTLLEKASAGGDNAGKIMDNFEATLGKFEAHFGSIAEQEKALSSILTEMGGNGGPPLEAVFPSSAPASVTVASTTAPRIDMTTGDIIKHQ